MSHVTRIMVTGGEGILAQALRSYFPYASYLGRAECDVANAQAVKQAFSAHNPELVVHCAALTSHNAEPFAYAVNNIQGTLNVVGNARRSGARVVYLSTDYLMAPREDAPVKPVNPYAASKYAGELVTGGLPNHLVIRGSWYSRLALSHAATDAFTTKLPVERAAYFVAALATSHHTGTVNIAGPRRTVYDIALEFNERVVPVQRSQIRCGYAIPADTSLDTTKLKEWNVT